MLLLLLLFMAHYLIIYMSSRYAAMILIRAFNIYGSLLFGSNNKENTENGKFSTHRNDSCSNSHWIFAIPELYGL